MRTLIIVPAHNEEDNLEAVISDLRRHCDEDILVVNDCSEDRTAELLNTLGIRHLDLPVNLGIGGTVQAGYKYAVRNRYDAAVQFDGDGQHQAQYISRLLQPIEENRADVAIGSRFLDRKGFQSSATRRAGIVFLSSLIYRLSGLKIKDVTSGMRAVNRKMIEMYADNYAQDYPEPEAILLAGISGARVEEVPVEMRERAFGTSSIKALSSIYYMIKVSLSLMIAKISMEKKNGK